MPNTAANELVVPDRGDPDRKRALNVLAQRRYRQRRRELLQALGGRSRASQTRQLSTPSTDDTSSSSITLSTPSEDAGGFAGPLQSYGSFDLIASNDVDAGTGSDRTATNSSYDDLFNFDMDISLFSSSQSDNLRPLTPSLYDSLQSLETAQTAFLDTRALPVPELRTLTASLHIASLLGCADMLWDPTALHVFSPCSLPLTFPSNLLPTSAQREIPHHPLLDILPWPAVRTRLIIAFAQPVPLRPPVARDPLALMNLVYDIEDSAGGVRVEGEDVCKAENWEVGQVLFDRWWWAFDREVVGRSNVLRARRGAARLEMGTAS